MWDCGQLKSPKKSIFNFEYSWGRNLKYLISGSGFLLFVIAWKLATVNCFILYSKVH